ncbi:MAG: hypothetical protein IJS69_03005, partial [Selenomonadaceae bacterium]|nr:hypothetical protein [Selenomonadaceae bacterium]
MEEKNSATTKNDRGTVSVAIIGGAIIAVLLILSTLWINHSEQSGTSDAVHSVSELYLRELTDRREQVINARINVRINDIQSALKILTPADLQSVESLTTFLGKMKTFCDVNQFAMTNANGVIFTPEGPLPDVGEYFFARELIGETKIFTYNLQAEDKSVAVVVPVTGVNFQGVPIRNCFIQLPMSKFLEGILVHTTSGEMTFFNLYYKDGESLTEAVLGSLDSGTNLLDALGGASFDVGYSRDKVSFDFANSRLGMASFTYRGINEMLYYRPVKNTGWLLTYLIRQNKIEEEIATVSSEMRQRSIIQILFTITAMIVVFMLIISQARKNTALLHKQNLAETENRIKREEMEEKLRLQTQLLSEERRRRRQSEMIQALTADYRLVYHLNLDSDEAVCYRVAPELSQQLKRRQSDVVKFQAAMQHYVNEYVVPNDREALLNFIQPENLRACLEKEDMISHRYIMMRYGEEHYMMLRVAKIDEGLHAVGVGFANVDEQTRESLARNQELAEALAQAQHANASKTVFLSNMSHDIRTPMNAIIGFTNLALRHFDNRTQVKDSLEKVLSSSNHLLGLINDILDMSRIESGRVEVVEQACNLSDLIHNLIHLIQPQVTAKQQKFHIDAFKVKNEDIYADQLKVNQVL